MIEKVSIILPTFNSEETVENTIKSIINQSYSNIELVIVDDGSKDNTINICSKYLGNSNIKLFSKENTGVSNTRNYAISKATGTYIMFIDSDDIYDQDCVKKMVEDIEKSGAQLTICGYKSVNYEKKKEIDIKTKKKLYYKLEFDKLVIDAQQNNLFNPVWNKIFLKEIIYFNKIKFDENLSLGEDYKFVLKYISCIDKVSIIEDMLYKYTNSISGLNMTYRGDRLEIILSNVKVMEDFFRNNKFDLTYINKKYTIAILSGIKNICLNPRKEEITKQLKRIKKDKFIAEKLNEKKEFKFNCISKIIKVSNVSLLKFYGKILIIYDRLYKKIKLGY